MNAVHSTQNRCGMSDNSDSDSDNAPTPVKTTAPPAAAPTPAPAGAAAAPKPAAAAAAPKQAKQAKPKKHKAPFKKVCSWRAAHPRCPLRQVLADVVGRGGKHCELFWEQSCCVQGVSLAQAQQAAHTNCMTELGAVFPLAPVLCANFSASGFAVWSRATCALSGSSSSLCSLR